jgi:ABC-type transport system involved in multi-copper enzyme maturation permease subunit
MALIRSELMKIRSTNVWWLFGIGILVFTALALTLWLFIGNDQINQMQNPTAVLPPPGADVPPEQLEQARQQAAFLQDKSRVLHQVASNIYTAGQFFGVMFVLLLGAILFTNENYHQTATATFLATPQRTKVILAKFATAMLAAGFFWVLTTAINAGAGAIFFNAKGYPAQFTEWPVTRAILMNGLAFGLWAVLGVGLGVLIRNQIGTVVTAAVGYIIGTQAVTLVFTLIHEFWIKKDWVMDLMVGWPSVASQVMVSSEPVYEGSPKWWVGALVLIGYGVVFGLFGTLLTRRRDIS